MDIFQQIRAQNWENVYRIINESPYELVRLDITGNNVLQTAIVNGADRDLIKKIIDGGAEVNLVSESGLSPFYFAVLNRSEPEIIELLLQNGAYINESLSKKRETVELCAQRNSSVEILKILIRMNGILKPNRVKQTLLHLSASGNSNPDVLRYLIDELKYNVNSEDSFGMTPLFYAVQENPCDDIMNTLLEKGADPGFVNRYGKRIIELNISKTRKQYLQDLLTQKGFNPDQKPKWNFPLVKKTSPLLNLQKIVLVDEGGDISEIPAWMNATRKDEMKSIEKLSEYSSEYSSSISSSISSGKDYYEITFTKPSLAVLKVLINHLDGLSKSTSFLKLVKNETEYMVIYGGYEDFFICWVMINAETDEILNLFRKISKGKSRCVSMTGEEGKYPAQQIVKRKDVLKIAEYYGLHGITCPDPDYEWR